ncbi:MAG: SGNH/GDSL hydrolase family protein, partial [Thiohalomonadales bacterium]
NDVPNVGAFNGKLDEVSVNDQTLSAPLVKQHYNDGVYGLHRGYVNCNSNIVKIMPLGDSITSGSGGSRQGGYRRSLARLLAKAGYRYDFVGRLDDAGEPFDSNHEGWSGYTIDDIVKNINAGLNANLPDVILLHIGTNGVRDSSGLEKIIDIVESFNEEITVVVARIINNKTPNSATQVFNDEVEKIVISRAANGSRLLLVDMGTALMPSDMNDEEHPVDSGYSKMAAVWFNGLSTFLPLCGNQSSIVPVI